MERLLINRTDWTGAPGFPEDWVVANAPRPLDGTITWVGEFRHGTFYAAAPEVVEGSFSWAADDALLVKFTTNDEIEKQVTEHIQSLGYASVDETCLSVGELAWGMGLPWHE